MCKCCKIVFVVVVVVVIVVVVVVFVVVAVVIVITAGCSVPFMFGCSYVRFSLDTVHKYDSVH